MAVFVCLVALTAATRAAEAPKPRVGPPTFNHDIAPLVFGHCAICHRPGQAAPFPFLACEVVRKHAKQIVQATQQRYMPPWLAAPGYGEFAHDRSLTDAQIALFKDWYDAGLPEGDPADLPPPPKFPENWQLGEPDFKLTLPEPFALRAEGKDVYRNLVVPIPLDNSRFIRGIEFHAGNPAVVHHAFVNVDETRTSRRQAQRETPAGFDGMELPKTANMPGGQFLSWQPGRFPAFSAEGLSWFLRTNTDLVLQLHMHPSGKPESVQPTIGFYFTDKPPTNMAFRIALKRFDLDIPPGESNYVAAESYVLPVDVKILRVLTHAHYLAKDLQAWGVTPSGEKKWLLWIKDWDFNWQTEYEFARPVELPKGSEIFMRFTYDNSAENPRNPNHPPKRTRFGLQTTDEMAELWLQALPANFNERAVLTKDYFSYLGRRTMEFDLFRLRMDPNDVEAHVRLGHDYLVTGQLERAGEHLGAAARIGPENPRARHEMGLFCLAQGKIADAEEHFLAATLLDPADSEAFGNLGYVFLQTGRTNQARMALLAALRVNPDDAIAAHWLKTLPAP
jgi:tetratricopeptide (TPR) repeat protein